MATYTWTGASSSDWSDGNNWDLLAVPGWNDLAQFNFSPGVNVEVSNPSTQMPDIFLNGFFGVQINGVGAGSFDTSGAGFSILLDVTAGGTLTLAIPISGTQQHLYAGNGTIGLFAANTMSGIGQIDPGDAPLILLGNNDALGTGTLILSSGATLNMNSLSVSSGASVSILSNANVISNAANSQALIILAGAIGIGFGLSSDVNGRVRVAGGSSLDLNGNNIPATIELNGGTVSNSAGFTGVVDVLATSYIYNVGDLDNASQYTVSGGGTFDGNGTDFSATGKVFVLTNGNIDNGIYEAAAFASLVDGTINGTIVGGTLTKNVAGTVVLTASNSHTATDIITGTLTAANVNAFGSGTVTTGVIAGSQGTVDLAAQPISNSILANNGIILGGNAFSGVLSVPALGVGELGAATAGTANVAPTGRLKVAAPHTGVVNNDGITEVNTGAGANPLNTYNASCGSNYVRAG